MEYSGRRNRHQEFLQRIFVNCVEEQENETKAALPQTLDELLLKIFDNQGS